MRLLVAWVGLVAAHPKRTLIAVLALTALAAYFATTRFSINSDLSQLIDQTSDWRVHFDRFEAEFPDLTKNAVLVVSGMDPRDLQDVTDQVLRALAERPNLASAVSAPGSEPFFSDHALLFLSLDELDVLVDQLSRAQPFLARFAAEPGVPSILDTLKQGIEEQADAAVLEPIVERLLASLRRLDEADARPISWSSALANNDEILYQQIFIKPTVSYDQTLPDAAVMAGLRDVVRALTLPSGVEVRITGEIALQHEEIESAVEGVTLAGWLAVLLLVCVLALGVRSLVIIGAVFSMLIIGAFWTGAFAMLAVGEYNTLSIVFIVMFFGLGVDFALHFSLRYQESLFGRGGAVPLTRLMRSTRTVGRAIALCSVTTAVGFLGFLPTAYQGLADLGLISAGGMLIAGFLTFTFLPAYFAWVREPRPHRMELPTSEGIVDALIARRGWVIGLLVPLVIGAGVFASRATFDYSVLALKNPASESMVTLRALQSSGLTTDYELIRLLGPEEDERLLKALEAHPLVASVELPGDLLPGDQDEKREVLEELGFVFFDVLNGTEPQVVPPNPAGITASLSALKAVSATRYPELSRALARLDEADSARLARWHEMLVPGLLREIDWLRTAMTVDAVTFDDLPRTTVDRLVSASGARLARIKPAEDIAEVEALNRFIEAVRAQEPSATGRPVIEWGVGGIVLESFIQAMTLALVGIFLILIVTLRKLRPTLLILVPLALAGLFTFAVGVLLDQPVNMASVLVLPLIFGLGVDNGIHVVDRYLGGPGGGRGVHDLMHSSTPRAVMLSSLTTIGAFAALSLSPHQGTATIGLLLTISVTFVLVFTIFLLPVLLSFLTVEQDR